jgi:2,4-dienoyl-CoA reductase-like NADH-dependent reductase (Old Yellow Enzyme family)
VTTVGGDNAAAVTAEMPGAKRYPHLLSPGAIGGVDIPNRIVQAPMGTGMIERGRVTDRDIAFQEERANAGVGLIITAAAPVHPTSTIGGRILTEAWDEDGVADLRRRVDAVHRHGTRIFGQILHLGREAAGDTQPGGGTEYVPLAPSAIPSPRNASPPHEMTTSEVRMLVGAFGRSAENFKAAGYDGVEIQACHGYLAAQFLTPSANRRTDAYRGDALEGRMRFLLEVLEEVGSRLGADYPVGVRLNAEDLEPGGLTFEDTLEIIEALQAAAPPDYLSITTGARGAYVKDTTFPEGFARDYAQVIKERVDMPVMVTGRFGRPDIAEQALAAGQADFIGLGRALLADPAWAAKVRGDRATEIRPCIGCLQDCRRATGLIGCTVHARTGREAEWRSIRRVRGKARVVVAGGGPAGLEAARVAADDGHDVVLFEQGDVLGGQLRLAAAGPTRAELLDFVAYADRELARLGVDVRLGVRATKAAVLGEAPDLVICATGARPLPPPFTIGGGAHIANVWDLLGGAVDGTHARALVIDDGTGFWPGASAAELLAGRGAAVELATRARGVALTIPHESVGNVLRRLRAGGVRFRTLVNVTQVTGARLAFSDAITGEPIEGTEADLVVIVPRLRVNDELVHELDGEVPALALIGDCASPRRLSHAILDANRALHRFNAGAQNEVTTVLF